MGLQPIPCRELTLTEPPPGQLGVQEVTWSGPATSPTHAVLLCILVLQNPARLKIFLKASHDFSFVYGSFLLDCLPSSPSLPTEFLLVLLLRSGVICPLGQGPDLDNFLPCGNSIIALISVVMTRLFSQQAYGLPEGWNFGVPTAWITTGAGWLCGYIVLGHFPVALTQTTVCMRYKGEYIRRHTQPFCSQRW